MKAVLLMIGILVTQVTFAANEKKLTVEELQTSVKRELKYLNLENAVLEDLRLECTFVEEVGATGKTNYLIQAANGVELRLSLALNENPVLIKESNTEGESEYYKHTYKLKWGQITFSVLEDSYDIVTIETENTKLTCGVYM